MPFDGREQFEKKSYALAVIDGAMGELNSPTKWCKGAFYTTDGRRCLVGAIKLAGTALRIGSSVEALALVKEPILRSIKEYTGKTYTAIEPFNDNRNTVYQDVMHVLARSREIIEKDIVLPSEKRSKFLSQLKVLLRV